MALIKLNLLNVFKCISQRRQFYRTSPISNKLIQFLLTDIGEGIREVEIKNWFVKVGDVVSQFDDICMVESDKATVNISSRYDGTIQKLYYNEGDKAVVGKPLVDIETKDLADEVGSSAEGTAILEGSKMKEVMKEVQDASDIGTDNRLRDTHIRPLATPSVRRIAMENKIKLESVKGTGKHGRILKEDIESFIKNFKGTSDIVAKISITDKTEFITGIRKVMVKTMTASNSIPTFGYADEIHVSKLLTVRQEIKDYAKKRNIEMTYMPFFIKALSKTLEKFPVLNASVDQNCEKIIYKSQHNIGVAMDTETGLIVPNIKNVQNLSILQIGSELNRLIKLGKEMKLTPNDISGGTITISNIGILGGTYVRPLLLPPEVCILALGRMQVRPVFNEQGDITRAHVIIASWAADHRIVDGATLARSSNSLKEYIENPTHLMMDL